ncbi:MAG: bifunctional diaminohydroxyphosphoribosylaminopyrimidine deaminase/5-amino-6-(5-phosphoribosylamino)uracil reductase RibD [bacterium]|nr:bifunctional diaminohydroxyphosphoribosylaminopyrimidine deaminase/5-amino-6-(5-phosphoribosylamino)uracil reductase RibD [bacterium]
MTHALALALRGTGHVSPNPRVGCVIVADNIVLAEGWHAEYGGPHAEAHALASLFARPEYSDSTSMHTLPENAIVYVTLEPCSHVGKRGSCADALLAAGARHVVIGMVDPYPEVNGRGIQRLHDNGVIVDVGICQDACAWTNRSFVKYVTTGTPYVVLKMAQTLDGFVAPPDRSRMAITGVESRTRVHALRAEFDAVLIGIGTALADDPELTVRDVDGRNPVRVVMDRRCLLPITSRLVQTAHSIRTLVACNAEYALINAQWIIDVEAHGIDVIQLDNTETFDSLFAALAERGIASVFCEGGARLAAALMGQHCVDELHVHVASSTMGVGHRWTPDEASAWQLHTCERVGGDVHLLLLPTSS